MPDIVINDVSPRTQYTATGGQTVFAYPFPIFAATDLKVYKRASSVTAANDSTQILTYTTDYTVTGVGAEGGGTVVLNTAATSGNIVTIIRDMPEDRLNNYIDGGEFQATDLNTDLDRTVLMNQTNTMYSRNVAPHYNTNDIINTNSNSLTPGVDTYLPVLPPSCSWRKNSAGTAIEAFAVVPTGTGVVLPTRANAIATFTETSGTLHDSGFLMPTVDGVANQALVTNGSGTLSFGYALPPKSVSGINMILNGDFQIWQRGAGDVATFSVSNSAIYTADRWQSVTSGAGTAATVSQQAGPLSGQFCARVQRDNTNTGTDIITLATSLLRDYCIGSAGNYLTLTFKARKGADYSGAASAMSVVVVSGTGTSDISNLSSSFTGAETVINENVTLTSSFQTFTITTSDPIGSSVTQLYSAFKYVPVGTAGAADYFEITDVQLEIGQIATSFDRRSQFETYVRCLELYCKSFAYNVKPASSVGNLTGEAMTPATVAGTNTNYFSQIRFPIPMRGAPASVITYSPGAAGPDAYNYTRSESTSGINVISATDVGFIPYYTGSASQAVGDYVGIHWTADIDVT